MNKNLIYSTITALVVSLVVGWFVLSNKPAAVKPLGGQTHLSGLYVEEDGLTVSGATTLGSSGTAANQLNWGSCNLQPDSATIAASTTARVTCHGGSFASGNAAFTALTGITSTSKIVASLSTTTAGSTIAGLHLLGVTASTTSGFIEARILNQTGTTYTWPTTGSASGTMQYIGIK